MIYILSPCSRIHACFERDLTGASATEFQGSCSPADFLKPLCSKPLWSLYRAISIHPRETCHPRVSEFWGAAVIIVILGFFGLFIFFFNGDHNWSKFLL